LGLIARVDGAFTPKLLDARWHPVASLCPVRTGRRGSQRSSLSQVPRASTRPRAQAAGSPTRRMQDEVVGPVTVAELVEVGDAAGRDPPAQLVAGRILRVEGERRFAAPGLTSGCGRRRTVSVVRRSRSTFAPSRPPSVGRQSPSSSGRSIVSTSAPVTRSRRRRPCGSGQSDQRVPSAEVSDSCGRVSFSEPARATVGSRQQTSSPGRRMRNSARARARRHAARARRR
jgi:hypothetical protein